jgi:hypothetical protein
MHIDQKYETLTISGFKPLLTGGFIAKLSFVWHRLINGATVERLLLTKAWNAEAGAVVVKPDHDDFDHDQIW